MSALLAVVEADPTLAQWVVGVVAAAILGVLAFLVRHAFARVETALEVVGTKLDDMSAAFARADGDRRVLEVRVVALEAAVGELKREAREMSEGIAR